MVDNDMFGGIITGLNMKIYIIGPSCVGKSTVANSISYKERIPHFDLDMVFIDRDYLIKTKIFRYRSEKNYKNKIRKILENNKDWIIEGSYLLENILNEAEVIVFINLPLSIPLIWQWKRYFTDKNQRDVYGVHNNLILSRWILGQYFGKETWKNFNSETSFFIRKCEDTLRNYRNKLIVIKSKKELGELQIGKK